MLCYTFAMSCVIVCFNDTFRTKWHFIIDIWHAGSSSPYVGHVRRSRL